MGGNGYLKRNKGIKSVVTVVGRDDMEVCFYEVSFYL